MSGSHLTNGAGQLQEAIDLLEQVWNSAETDWDDTVREQFEENWLQPLRKDLRTAQQAIQTMADLLGVAHRHVADRDRGHD